MGWVAVDLPSAEQADDPVRDLIGTPTAAMMENWLTRLAENDSRQRVCELTSLDWREDGKV